MIKNRQKGVSLIVTFFILTIISAVILSIIAILYSQIKVIRNMGNSIASYYAAESGIEKVSYYDRKAIPFGGNRGLCYMCDSANPDRPTSNCVRTSGDSKGEGCDSDKCANCTIKFTTFLGEKIYYEITAKVFSSPPPPGFTITAIGSYKEVKRAIQIMPMQ